MADLYDAGPNAFNYLDLQYQQCHIAKAKWYRTQKLIQVFYSIKN